METLGKGPCSVKALAEATGVNYAYVSTRLKKLEAAGHVHAKPGEDDARVRVYERSHTEKSTLGNRERMQ